MNNQKEKENLIEELEYENVFNNTQIVDLNFEKDNLIEINKEL